jgi:UDP-glucose 4-epimerase
MLEFKDKLRFKKAIVTGGAGFIGSHLVEELLRYGISVISIDDYSAGKEENLVEFAKNPLLKIANCSVTDYDALKKLFAGVDLVFHEACSKKTVCLKDPRLDLDVNAKGTFNMLELSREFKVKKFVHASSGSVYGEAQYFPQDEKHPLVPTSYYGVSKLAGEKYVKVFNHLYGLNTTVLRYFHVYGARQEFGDYGGVVPIFARRVLNDEPPLIHGDGSQERSFTYVKDVVRANFLVACDPHSEGEVYNCASGIKVTIQELADKVVKHFRRTDLVPIHDDWAPGDIKIFNVDNRKLKSLGFQFITPFDSGFATTMDWMAERLR